MRFERQRADLPSAGHACAPTPMPVTVVRYRAPDRDGVRLTHSSPPQEPLTPDSSARCRLPAPWLDPGGSSHSRRAVSRALLPPRKHPLTQCLTRPPLTLHLSRSTSHAISHAPSQLSWRRSSEPALYASSMPLTV